MHCTRLIGLLLLLCCTRAQAADWVKMEIPSGTPDTYYYDRSKLVVNGNTITYWKKIQFSPPRKIKQGQVSITLMRESIDCREHTLRLLSYLYNDATGTTIDSSDDAEKEAKPIIPDSIGDHYEQKLCPLTNSTTPPDNPAKAEPHAL